MNIMGLKSKTFTVQKESNIEIKKIELPNQKQYSYDDIGRP